MKITPGFLKMFFIIIIKINVGFLDINLKEIALSEIFLQVTPVK